MASFTIEPFLDVLANEAWRQENDSVRPGSFPSTAREFVELIFSSGNAFETDADGVPTAFRQRVDQDQVTSDEQRDRAIGDLSELSTFVFDNWDELVSGLETMMSDWYRKTLLNLSGWPYPSR